LHLVGTAYYHSFSDVIQNKPGGGLGRVYDPRNSCPGMGPGADKI
jgi:hypothetical protein